MDNKKFEQLIDLIINENEEQAKALFHDIVVEKSREIYESMMDEEQMMNQPSGQVQDLLDEIGSEEQGMAEAEDEEFDIADMDDGEGDEESVDIEMDSEEGGEEGLEDRVVDLEDKLDQLMAEFEDIMGGEEGDMDMGGEEGDMDMDMDDMGDDDMDGEEDPMMEAITLKKVSVTHGDNGVQTKSTVAANSGQRGMASKPVAASTTTETGRTAPTTKDLKGAGSFKNAPGQKKQDLSAAPKPVTKDGSSNDRSPVAK